MNRLAACMLLASLSGCSLVYTEKDIAGAKDEFATFEPKLVGEWGPDKEEPPGPDPDDPKMILISERLSIERKSPDSNVLLGKGIKLVKPAAGGEAVEKVSRDPPLEMRCVKLGRLDLLSVNWGRTKQPPGEAYMVARLTWSEEGFALALMDSTFFEKNPKLVAHRKGKSNVVITADVEGLREFLKANGEQADLWDKPENQMQFRRWKQPAVK